MSNLRARHRRFLARFFFIKCKHSYAVIILSVINLSGTKADCSSEIIFGNITFSLFAPRVSGKYHRHHKVLLFVLYILASLFASISYMTPPCFFSIFRLEYSGKLHWCTLCLFVFRPSSQLLVGCFSAALDALKIQCATAASILSCRQVRMENRQPISS
jgi:4-amino-4-deoxy-L-arabinose transferase-like glycosyltransferase